MRPPWAAQGSFKSYASLHLNSHWHAAEHRRGCRKRVLSAASLQSPGSIEEYPMRGINSGHPARGGTRDTGGPFFGSFLWASKEMNRRR